MRMRKKAMLEQLTDPSAAERWCATRTGRGESLGLIPTMGALHEGHLSLVERSVADNEHTCVSIFVNPLQFGQEADFTFYPRDWRADCEQLQSVGCDMVFTGELTGFFPGRLDSAGKLLSEELIEPGEAAVGLEGEFRRGHFEGVATICHRLFELTHASQAYFGQKDFQQTLVVQHVARRLGYPEIVVCPTSRESGGLARSSRNLRLSEGEKHEALVLSRALRAAREAWNSGERDALRLQETMQKTLRGASVDVEYAAVRNPERWTSETPQGALEQAVALVAANVGPVRLIDNMVLSEPEALAE